tara:strand:- start:688 stop:867 length:180 start_codon:yes stop_codon:yes gene_type:complete
MNHKERNNQILSTIRKFDDHIRSLSNEEAKTFCRNYLKLLGTHDEYGRLTKEFGGECND